MQIYQWINKSKDRFYKVTLCKDEYKIVLNYHWGGCNSNRGGKKEMLLRSEEEAQRTIGQMMKRRKSRGYELITPLMN